MSRLSGKRFLQFVEDEYEDLELWYPKIRLAEEGAQVVTVGSEKGRVYRGKNGYPCKADSSFDEVRAGDFDGSLIPEAMLRTKSEDTPRRWTSPRNSIRLGRSLPSYAMQDGCPSRLAY